MSRMTATPNIYSPRIGLQRLGLGYRALAAGIGLGCLTMLIIGYRLQPNPSGMGTHHALGLQPCQFLLRTGLPCPTCGMTTSVTHLAHGNVLASLWVQPMGTLVGLAATLAFWIGLYIAITGRPALRLMQRVPTGYYVLLPMFLGIAAWGWKIVIHWRGMDGWGGG